MRALPHLGFDGRCAEAFRFYESVFGGRLELTTHGESPLADRLPPGLRDRILHASLTSGDLCVVGSDLPPDWHDVPQGVSVSVQLADVAEAERIFASLSESGAVEMPLCPTPWAARFGMATDRFGIPWMVSCTTPA
jgi:PhnB protein